ncbi:MAG TPA: hypothetical protein VMD56_08695 [Steroidobacteraceae bacterium]|nr:hypothetical protein [Steroidobacteraceae bacterium]
MPDPTFPSLRRRLIAGGISPRRVRRLLQELRDHYTELVLEQQRTGSPRPAEAASALLGTEESLAAQLLARRELLSWSRRWPWAVYALAPLLIFPTAFVATICLMVGLAHVLNGMRHSAPVAFLDVMRAIRYFDLYLMPVIVASGLAVLARRRGVSPVWAWLSIALFALLSSLTNISVTLQHIGAGAGVSSRPAILIPLLMKRWLPTAAAAAAIYTVVLHWALRRDREVPD